MKNITVLFLMMCVFTTLAQPVKKYGQLKVSGTLLVDADNHPVALHGMSLGWSTFHPRFYTAGVVKWLATDWNCSVIRAALGVEPDKGYLKNKEQSMALITTVVDAAIKNGIYVIIDWHSHNIHRKEAKDFFQIMSAKYKGHPNIIYEIFNEPDHETWEEVKSYSTEIIKVIRKNDPLNIILVGNPRWDQEIMLPANNPIKGFDNLMYTMHFYAGTHKKWLRERTDSANQKGLPVFISESAGMEATGDGPIDIQEWNEFISWMDSKKLSWLAWSVSDKNESCSVLLPSASSNGKWKKKDLKTAGIKTRQYLRTYK